MEGCLCPASAKFILLTGPNMGGKSTLLRQVCLAVILAHVGADVPAGSLESPVDPIFVRMGAKDHIMAGRSTFLNELSETASVLSAATSNRWWHWMNWAVALKPQMDKPLSMNVFNSLSSFSCQNAVTIQGALRSSGRFVLRVSLCHMACQVGDGGDSMEEVTFLYRSMSGACPKSYGVNVARLAGIPESILLRATIKSREFEESDGRQEKLPQKNPCMGNRGEEILPFV